MSCMCDLQLKDTLNGLQMFFFSNIDYIFLMEIHYKGHRQHLHLYRSVSLLGTSSVQNLLGNLEASRTWLGFSSVAEFEMSK